MSGTARIEREQIRKFNQYWEDLYEEFPGAKRKAVEAMGEAVQRELDANIQRADLEAEAKGHVRGWQELRMGSGGGYAALTPSKGKPVRARAQWRGQTVTTKMVTKWLERGHGVRKPAAGSERAWNRFTRSGLNRTSGTRYVAGRMFYSWTKLRALDIALEAAGAALEEIADGP